MIEGWRDDEREGEECGFEPRLSLKGKESMKSHLLMDSFISKMGKSFSDRKGARPLGTVR